MPKRKRISFRDPNYIPSMTRHKASGRAVVRLNGKDYYLGPWGSSEATVAYGKLIAQWKEQKKFEPLPKPDMDGLTVNELILAFVRYAEGYYVKDGRTTGEYDCILSAMRPVKELYGLTPVSEFGPLKAKQCREWMIRKDWSRGYINRCMSRVKRMLRWGVENELCEPRISQAIDAIKGLAAGRSAARESPGRKPVKQEHIDAVRAVVGQRLRDLIDMMLLTGARPGELLSLTGRMIDRTGEVWSARLTNHKTVHQGKGRVLFFGPQAQLILRRYIKKNPDARLWKIKTFRCGIRAACARAGVPRWTPYALRHNHATKIREQFGLEAAQVILGHSRADVTQVYAQRNEKAAREVILKVG